MTNGMERRVAEWSKQFHPGYICGRARMSYGQSWNKRPQGKLALGPTLDQEVKTNFLTYSSISLSTHNMDIFSWGKTPPDFPRCRGEAFSTNWVTIRLSLCVPQGRKWTLNGPDKSHPSHIKTGAKFSVRTPGRSHSTDTHTISRKKASQIKVWVVWLRWISISWNRICLHLVWEFHPPLEVRVNESRARKVKWGKRKCDPTQEKRMVPSSKKVFGSQGRAAGRKRKKLSPFNVARRRNFISDSNNPNIFPPHDNQEKRDWGLETGTDGEEGEGELGIQESTTGEKKKHFVCPKRKYFYRQESNRGCVVLFSAGWTLLCAWWRWQLIPIR